MFDEVPWLLRPIHLRPFIWDHIHLRPINLRPLHLRPLRSRPVHLRSHSFESTFIWDHIHLRPHSFETTFIWDHIHLRPHLFETTFIWDHIYLRPHSFEITFILRHVKVKLFWYTVYHILWSTYHFLAADLKFCKETIHLKFRRVAPFRVQWWLTLSCKCTRIQGRIKGGNRGNFPGIFAPRGPSVMTWWQLFVLNKMLVWKIVIQKRYKNTNLYSGVAVSMSVDFSTSMTVCQF